MAAGAVGAFCVPSRLGRPFQAIVASDTGALVPLALTWRFILHYTAEASLRGKMVTPESDSDSDGGAPRSAVGACLSVELDDVFGSVHPAGPDKLARSTKPKWRDAIGEVLAGALKAVPDEPIQ